ncbi:MAG: methyltransferase domain-containing protein [Candidatus Caldatribacteriota bacterium]|nr:methyltransferase domain-containing protein [Candidatus Caldatribacteriota bacterium]
MKILNLGSGSSRDAIEILSGNSYLMKSISIDCVDIDSQALQKGNELIKGKNYGEINFIEGNLLRLPYRKEIDLGLMIGVLCGLENGACITVLKRIKRYFKESGILIASNVTMNMPNKDPFTSYLLKEVIGWKLVCKTPEELREIFEKAGYEWKGIFYDEPTKFHGMGIGVA